jgi:hypothetical protein
VVADPDVGVFADEVVVDGAGEVGVDVGEGDVGGDADGVGAGVLVLVVESLVALLDEGDGDVTNLVDVGLDLNAGLAAAVAGDSDVAGLAGEVDASLGELWRRKRGERGWVESVRVSFSSLEATQSGSVSGSVTLNRERIRAGGTHLEVDVLELADVGDGLNVVAGEVGRLVSVSCGREGEEASAKVRRRLRGMRFSGGENILRFEPRNAGPSVKRRFANGRRERRVRFRVRTNTNDEVDSKSWRAHLPGEKPGLAVRVTAPPLAKPAVAVSLKDWLAMVPLPLASSCELRRGRAGFRVSHHASRVSERFGAFASRRGVATRPIRRGRFAALEN